MKLTTTIVYECGCKIPMEIDINNMTTSGVRVNGHWSFESEICPKHSEQTIYQGRHYNENPEW
jgi:hypothetical protein